MATPPLHGSIVNNVHIQHNNGNDEDYHDNPTTTTTFPKFSKRPRASDYFQDTLEPPVLEITHTDSMNSLQSWFTEPNITHTDSMNTLRSGFTEPTNITHTDPMNTLQSRSGASIKRHSFPNHIPNKSNSLPDTVLQVLLRTSRLHIWVTALDRPSVLVGFTQLCISTPIKLISSSIHTLCLTPSCRF